MERITNQNLAERRHAVNRALVLSGATDFIFTQGRNGYTGLDLADKDGSCLRTLTVGTKREVYEYMGAMLEMAWMLGPNA